MKVGWTFKNTRINIFPLLTINWLNLHRLESSRSRELYKYDYQIFISWSSVHSILVSLFIQTCYLNELLLSVFFFPMRLINIHRDIYRFHCKLTRQWKKVEDKKKRRNCFFSSLSFFFSNWYMESRSIFVLTATALLSRKTKKKTCFVKGQKNWTLYSVIPQGDSGVDLPRNNSHFYS